MGLGQEEMGLVAARDTERLSGVLLARESAIQRFLASDAARRDEEFLDKLARISAMNGQLQREVRALHQSLKEELLKLRSENRRMGGYRNGALITPLSSRRIMSRRG